MKFAEYAIPVLSFTALGIISVLVGGAITVWITAIRYHAIGTFKNLLLYFTTLLFAPPLMFLGFLALIAIWLFNIFSKKKVEATRLNELNGQIVTIFVHGTFEPDAVWTRAENPLRGMIQSKFSKKVNFERFVWSGANLISERKKAAEGLKEMIQHYQQRDCCVHVVAHSHGGAAVISALSGLPAPNSTTFMATPFISFELLTYPALTRRLLGFGIFTAMAFLPSVLAYIFHFANLQKSAFIFSTIFALLAVMSTLPLKLVRFSKDDYTPENLLQDTALKPSNTRIYISNGDEAGALLQFLSLLSSVFRNLTSNLFDAADVLDDTVSNRRKKNDSFEFNILHIALFSIFAALLAVFIQISAEKVPHVVFIFFYSTLIIALSAGLASALIKKGTVSEHISTYLIFHASMAAIINAITKISFGFGINEATARHEIFVTSSETPVGRWVVQKYPAKNFKGLQHSRIYQDKATQEDIAKFIWKRTPSRYK